MATTDTSWYEMIGQNAGVSPKQLVQCDRFATAVSLEEMTDVTISCVVPITKFAYRIHDRESLTVKEGAFAFSPEGVHRLILGQVLPMAELRPYETENADYGIATTVTLITGDEVGGSFSFACWIRSGVTTTEVPGTDLRSRLAAIPVARPGMTEEQLRQICLDYIKLETEFPFKFREDFTYTIQSQKRRRKLIGGKVYGGLPYVSRGAGNLYRIGEIYDPETGILDTNSSIFDDIRYFGNACSGAASMAWARVVTSAYLGYTMFMTEANGFLPVGPYRYPKENLTKFVRNDPQGVCCATVCSFNGEQTMYESYAQMKPADGAVCDGHVRMNSAIPTVIRRPDGSIDPDASFALMRDQVCYVAHPNHLRIAPDGSHYVAQGYVDMRYTFRLLFENHYVPFTFQEFRDPSRVEPARIRLSVEPELWERVITCNYPISDVFAERGGKRYTFRNMEFFRKEVKMGDIFPMEALGPDTRIFCQLYNGQLLEALQ